MLEEEILRELKLMNVKLDKLIQIKEGNQLPVNIPKEINFNSNTNNIKGMVEERLRQARAQAAQHFKEAPPNKLED